MGSDVQQTDGVNFMNEAKIAEYRAAATDCRAQAAAEPNKSTAARWRQVAEEWDRMAKEVERLLPPS